MKTHKLGMTVILALAVGVLPSNPVDARSSRAGPQTATRGIEASRDTTSPDSGPSDGAGSTGERTDQRAAFVVSPGFSGPVLLDPFGYGPAWGWWGLEPVRPGYYVTWLPVPPNMARLSLHVRPRKADLVIDGTDVGEARD